MTSVGSNEQVGIVQINHSPDLSSIPREVFLSISCARAQARMTDIKQTTLLLLQDCLVGDNSRMEAVLTQIAPCKKAEFELMAQVIISKALDEPQYCQACVSLSGALNMLLPALPSGLLGKKGETFMHSLLDMFQTKFEEVFNLDPSAQGISNSHEETQATFGCHWATQRDHQRIRAIVHFAGHLYCHGLLGNGVVSQMVQDLVDSGETEAANELICFIGVVRTPSEQPNLGTVLEDAGDSDGGSSESISNSERRPSCP